MDFQSIILDIIEIYNQESKQDKSMIYILKGLSILTGLFFHRADGNGRIFRTQTTSRICSNEGLFGRIS